MIMVGPRVYARMAEDGLFPRILTVSSGPPRVAIGLQVGLALVFLWLIPLRDLMSYIGYTLSLSTALTVAGVFVLRRRDGPAQLPLIGYPWVPLLYVVASIAIATFFFLQNPKPALLGLGTILAGVPIYAWFRSRSGG